MTLKQSIKKIVSQWEELHKKQNQLSSYWGHPKSVVVPAVWCAKSDLADSYEVDEEWIGISPQGNLVWAYASGCSCWDGDYTEDTKPTMKELTLVHEKHTPDAWEKAIIAFAETLEVQDLPR